MTKNEAITADLEQKSLIAATEATATTEAQFLEHLGRWQNVCQQDSPQSAPA
jgi:predicted metal-dependent phosphotriesterase family hydrolase